MWQLWSRLCVFICDWFNWSFPSSKRPALAAWPRCTEASCRPKSGRCLFRSRLQGSGRPCPVAPTRSCNNLLRSAFPPPASPEETITKSVHIIACWDPQDHYKDKNRTSHSVQRITIYGGASARLTSWIIVAASPYTTPIHTSSDCTLERSGTPSGRMPFTAPIRPPAKLMTFRSNMDFSAVRIFSFGKAWKEKIVVLRPAARCWSNSWSNLQPSLSKREWSHQHAWYSLSPKPDARRNQYPAHWSDMTLLEWSCLPLS